ncbi:class I SAM-dependent methyltransferase [Geobacter sp.]|uniref:class I SAM-dependent methyltransferase n=1 Tax=Geobacter sp. TaxID=46610 RepID=UPI00262B8BD1|nr:class I SAM-dependent methyltransferase [Geobacter sp.]
MATGTDKAVLNQQNPHWEKTYANVPEMFGEEPSEPAKKAEVLFRAEGVTKVLELGAGQGRDTVFFARNGYQVYALDYSETGVDTIREKVRALELSQSVTALRHDVRQPLPFEDESFDACYSHMLFCMALTTAELEFLSREIRRVLKPGGINMYTVRHTGDPHCGTGIHRGENMYEVGGFIVHFFSREKVELLAKGYEILGVEEFEEGTLPRKLFRVTLRKRKETRNETENDRDCGLYLPSRSFESYRSCGASQRG